MGQIFKDIGCLKMQTNASGDFPNHPSPSLGTLSTFENLAQELSHHAAHFVPSVFGLMAALLSHRGFLVCNFVV